MVRVFRFAFLVLLYPTYHYANPLNNLHGDIGVEFTQEETESDNKTTIDKLSQVLNLNYQDFIYDRRLLDYYFRVKLSENNQKKNDGGANSENTYETNEYDVKFNFFKLSQMPFSIQAKQTEKPATIINEDSIVETTYNKTDYSINGKVNTDFVNVSYNANTAETDTRSELGLKNLSTSFYGIGFTKELFEDARITLNFNNDNSISEQQYGDQLKEDRTKNTITTSYSDSKLYVSLNHSTRDEKDTDNTESSNNTIDYTSTNINYKFSETISTKSSFSTESNEEDKSTNDTAKLSLRWKPTKTYDLNSSFNTDMYTVDGAEYNNYNFDIFSNYRISPNLTNSQSLSYLDVLTPGSTHKTYQLSTITNYKKQLTPKLKWNLSNTISSITNKNTSNEANVDIEDDQSFIFNISSSLIKRLSFWNASNGYKVDFDNTFSDTSESTTLKLSSYFNSMPTFNTEYNVDADITNEDANNQTSTTINLRNHFRYFYNFDVRGQLNIDASLNYKNIQEETSSTSSLDPSVNATFNYRLWRTLTFKSLYGIMVDELNKTTTHTLNTGLYYQFRELAVTFTVDMIDQAKDESDDFSSQTVFLAIKRKF